VKVQWPEGKRFAFTICDDPDFSTIENTRPVYDFLASLGMRTTKLVWPLHGEGPRVNGGDSCEDPRYLNWILSLQKQGFEIALHNVAASTSGRRYTERGLDHFRALFGAPPRLHANHTGCLENIYWGNYRVTGWRRPVYRYWTRGTRTDVSRGHLKDDPLFWGDICGDQIQYVRNFTCDALNTLHFCPQMPYHDPNRPYVNYWFAATTASSPRYFRNNFTIRLVDKLIDEGGLCIAYVHFGAKFYDKGTLDPHFQAVMEHVADHDGWFVPVSEILDYLRNSGTRKARAISSLALQELELKWFLAKYGKKLGI
jgi:hypothetical protein